MKKLFALLLSVAMAASLFAGVAFAVVPTVTFTPNNNAVDVAVNVSPTITFSEAVQAFGGATPDSAYLADSVTLLQGATVVPFSASLSANGRILTIDPTNDLGIGLPYTLTVLANRFERVAAPHGLVGGASATFTTVGALADITSFTIPGQVSSLITDNGVAPGTIVVTVPFGTVVTGLVPTIALSAGATVTPASGAARDFTGPGPVVYTVTAQNGTTDVYNVTVTVAPASAVADITSFTIPGQVSSLITDNGVALGTIVVTVPFGTVVTGLVPTIALSAGATVTPASGAARDFTAPVVYTVTAQNGTVDTYTVTVTVAAPLPNVFLTGSIIHGAIGLNNNVVIGGSLMELGRGTLSAERFLAVQHRAPNATVWHAAPGVSAFSLAPGSVGSFNFQYRFTAAGDYRLAALTAAGGVAVRQDGADVAINLGTVTGLPLTITTPTTTVRWSVDAVTANQTITLPLTVIREALGVLPMRVVAGTQTLGSNMVRGNFTVTYAGVTVTPTASFDAAGVTTLVITRGATAATGTLLVNVTDDTGNWSGQISINVAPLAAFNANTRLIAGALTAGRRVQFETTVASATGGDIAADQYTMTTITNPAGAVVARLRTDGATPGQTARTAAIVAGTSPIAHDTLGILLATPGTVTATTVLYNATHHVLGQVVETFTVTGGLVVNLTSGRVGETVRLSATVTDRNGNPLNAASVRFTAASNMFVQRNAATGLFPTHPTIANATNVVTIDGWNLMSLPGQAVSNGTFTAEVILVDTGTVTVEVFEAVQTAPGAAITAATTAIITRGAAITVLPRLYAVTAAQSTFVTAHPEVLTFTVRDAAGNLVNEQLAAPAILNLTTENLTPTFAPIMVSPGVWSGLFTAEEPGTVRIRMAGLGDNSVNGVEFTVTVVNPRAEINTSKSLVTSDFFEVVTVSLFDPRNDQPIALPLQVREGRTRTPDRAWRPTANLSLETRATATAPWTAFPTTGLSTGLGAAMLPAPDALVQTAAAVPTTTQVRNFAPAAVHEFRVLTWSQQERIAGVEQPATLRYMASIVEGSASEHFAQTLAPATITLSATELRAGVANPVTLTLKNAHGVAFGSIPQQGAGAAIIPAVNREIVASGRWVSDFNMPENGIAQLVIRPEAMVDGLIAGNIRFDVESDRARTGVPLAPHYALRTDIRVTAPLDTAAPVITVTAPATTADAVAQIVINVTDDNAISTNGIAFNGERIHMNQTAAFSIVRNVNLVMGVNTFIIDAMDVSLNNASRTVQITRTAPPAGDTAAPVIEVTVPAVTTEATAVVTVTVRDNVNLAANGIIFDGAVVPGFATRESVFTRTVNLREGMNIFTVAAQDAAGNVATRTIAVERRTPPAPVSHTITIGRANPAIGLDVPANVRNGRLMVPFRWFGERILEATVDYRVVGAAEIVTLVKGNITVELTLNSTIATVNGTPVSLDVAAFATGGRTLVPARFLAETFGYTVNWNPADDSVTITKR